MAYEEARVIQERLAAERRDGGIQDLLLALEHPPVVTVGRGWGQRPTDARSGAAPTVVREDWLRVGRGGGPTYHGPGQLVLYPLVMLRSRGRGVRTFVDAFERALCDAAGFFGVPAVCRPGLPGAWIDAPDGWRKLGSVGIAVRRGVTLHGAALNVERCCEAGFRDFAPCGQSGVRATSLEAERVGPPPTLREVARVVARTLAEHLESDRDPLDPSDPRERREHDLHELRPRDVELSVARAPAAPLLESKAARGRVRHDAARRPPTESSWN